MGLPRDCTSAALAVLRKLRNLVVVVVVVVVAAAVVEVYVTTFNY